MARSEIINWQSRADLRNPTAVVTIPDATADATTNINLQGSDPSGLGQRLEPKFILVDGTQYNGNIAVNLGGLSFLVQPFKKQYAPIPKHLLSMSVQYTTPTNGAIQLVFSMKAPMASQEVG